MLFSYLCGICQTLQFLSMMVGACLAIHIFIIFGINTISSTCEYEENRKQTVIPKKEKVFCVIFILLAVFIPTNLKWDLIDSYKKDLEVQKTETRKANEQIGEFKIFLETRDLEDEFLEFDKQYKLLER